MQILNSLPFKKLTFLSFILILNYSCTEKKLGILGIRQLINNDTVYAEIPNFEYLDQNNNLISLNEVAKGIHVGAFFFTSCPTICPKVMRNIGRINDKFSKRNDLSILCFSLDFKRDSIARLKEYYDKVGFTNPRLHLLRGNQSSDIKDLTKHYMSIAIDDDSVPGGINHSGWILLVDRKKHLRSYALGTDDKDIDRFMEDIQWLLDEK